MFLTRSCFESFIWNTCDFHNKKTTHGGLSFHKPSLSWVQLTNCAKPHVVRTDLLNPTFQHRFIIGFMFKDRLQFSSLKNTSNNKLNLITGCSNLFAQTQLLERRPCDLRSQFDTSNPWLKTIVANYFHSHFR